MGRGMGSAEKAVERSAQKGGGDGKYLPMVWWKDDRNGKGEEFSKIVRFLNDDVITCKFYEFIKGGPDGKGRDFAAPGSLVDDEGKPLFKELAGEKDYFLTNNIKLPDFKGNLKPAKDIASEKTVGIVVLRQEDRVQVDGKRKSILSDKIVKNEWEDSDGKAHSEEGLSFGIVKQGHKNFWATLVGYYNRYGTITDRDYEIQRKGNGKDTSYIIMPLDPDPELDTQEKVDARYLPKEKDSDDRMKLRVTLDEWIVPKAKYEAAAEWHGGAKSAPSADESDDKPSEATSEREDDASTEVKSPSSSTAKSLKEELEGYKET